MKEKLLFFLLATALTACLTAYLFYHVGLISWLSELSPKQWGMLALMSGLAGLVLSQGYLFVVRVCPWEQGHLTRSVVLLSLLTGTLAAFSYFLDGRVKGWLLGFDEVAASLSGSLLVKGSLVGMILSLLVIWIDYSWFAFARYSKQTIQGLRSTRTKKELQFNLLRSQLTPHFLFNSLNTASYLATSHPDQAEVFIRKLAYNFTHLIQNGSQALNTLERELEIVDNFMHLMNVRYGDKVVLEKRIKPATSECLLPALAIQLLVENALKHNVASLDIPLKIMITVDQLQVVVTNTRTSKPEKVESTGIGLKNLRERYRFFGKSLPVISQTEAFYEVRLPFVNPTDTDR